MLVISESDWEKVQHLSKEIEMTIADATSVIDSLQKRKENLNALFGKIKQMELSKLRAIVSRRKNTQYLSIKELVSILEIVSKHTSATFLIDNIFATNDLGQLLRTRPHPEARYMVAKIIIEDLGINIQQSILGVSMGFADHTAINYAIARHYELEKYDSLYKQKYATIKMLCMSELDTILNNNKKQNDEQN